MVKRDRDAKEECPDVQKGTVWQNQSFEKLGINKYLRVTGGVDQDEEEVPEKAAQDQGVPWRSAKEEEGLQEAYQEEGTGWLSWQVLSVIWQNLFDFFGEYLT